MGFVRLPFDARALVVAVGVMAAACSGSSDDGADAPPTRPVNVVLPGAPGETSRVLSPEEVADVQAAADALSEGYTATDVAFVQMMIEHHRQALEMVALVEGRHAHPDLPVLSERLAVGQNDEIEQMRRWLTDRGEPLEMSPDDHAGHTMPGLLSAEQMQALAAAEGEAFDVAYLQSMIYHHEGALTMVTDLFDAGAGTETELFTLASHVASEQQVEISRMTHLLADVAAP